MEGGSIGIFNAESKSSLYRSKKGNSDVRSYKLSSHRGGGYRDKNNILAKIRPEAHDEGHVKNLHESEIDYNEAAHHQMIEYQV